jgi:hypothetical protein
MQTIEKEERRKEGKQQRPKQKIKIIIMFFHETVYSTCTHRSGAPNTLVIGMNIIGSSRGQRVLAAHIAMLIAMRL